jgi:hypothetical protein
MAKTFLPAILIRDAMSLEEQIAAVEEEIRNTPYNKATSHHIGRLKAKLARLREEALKRASAKSGGEGFAVRKSGHATVALVGFPSVGKSTLLNRLTDAHSEVGDFEFTTLSTVPGMLEHRGAQIQILDIPGLIRGAASGRGRGREVISVVRSADMILLLLDVFNLHQYNVMIQELYNAGIRINQKPPDVLIKRKARGGIHINTTTQTHLSTDVVKSVLSEYRIHNADVLIREDITVEQLIDALQGNRRYMPAITVINKVDLADEHTLAQAKKHFKDAIFISAEKNQNIDTVKDAIFNTLNFIRIYLKPQRGEADLKEPLILRKGATVGDVCDTLHRDFRRKFRYANIWGTSAKHNGQRVGLEHVLEEGDILTIIVRK